ncbi:MAG: hypothetical protein GKR88_09075 [Flavobacteriaceae bacterium]|nr:MAG: hypothetical protein GKR88_09075 [Flavobacteriaceae bacterium]
MKKVFLLVVLLFFTLLCFSQNPDEFELQSYENNVKTIISPTVSSLGSYSYAPVSLARGETNISIPIWNITGNSISLPISMSYRQGVKIENTSEYTGHNWSLMAGGVITRRVLGEVDPFPRLDLANPLTYQETISVDSRQYDVAPDVFSYNFSGYTGQLALKNDLVTPYFIKEQRNWKFVLNNDVIEITTEDGTKYIFRDTETSTIEREGGLILRGGHNRCLVSI